MRVITLLSAATEIVAASVQGLPRVTATAVDIAAPGTAIVDRAERILGVLTGRLTSEAPRWQPRPG